MLLVDGGESYLRIPGIDARARAYRNLRRTSVDGAGHMMHWTEPARTSNAVLAFLRDVLG